MLLTNKTAVIHGAGGAVGNAVAKAFAREGARLFLAGRTRGSVDKTASSVPAGSEVVETAEVDALDELAVERHATRVVAAAGRIDVVLNAVGFDVVQGKPLVDLSLEDFAFPIATWTSAQFLTARAAARHMMSKRSGVILTLSASPARMAMAMTGGFGVACTAIEGLSRTLAAGLDWIMKIESRGELSQYHLLPAAKAGFLFRLGRWREAAAGYEAALALAANPAERRYLARRLAECDGTIPEPGVPAGEGGARRKEPPCC